MPPTNASAFVAASNLWAGDGTGYCGWLYAPGDGGFQCQNPTSPVGGNIVSVFSPNPLNWLNSCTGGGTSNCQTAFWGGLSQQETATGYLLQNGVQCNIASPYPDYCYAFYEDYPADLHEISFPSQPSTFNGVAYVFNTFFVSDTVVQYQDTVGSWFAAVNEALPSGTTASNFYQVESIMETPTVYGNRVNDYVAWSPNPIQLQGSLCNPQQFCQYYGTQLVGAYYNYLGSTLQAYGSQTIGSSGNFPITYTGQ